MGRIPTQRTTANHKGCPTLASALRTLAGRGIHQLRRQRVARCPPLIAGIDFLLWFQLRTVGDMRPSPLPPECGRGAIDNYLCP